MANPQNVTGFGVACTIIASNTFPTGLPITQFADDTDPVTINDVKIADTAMGLNGDLLTWNRATPLPITISVVPGGADDTNLQILADANRVGLGKNSAKDVISITLVYPDLQTVVLSGGVITDGAFGRGIQSSGRQKTKTYNFMMAAKA
jgi:hypothetical protein